MSQSIKNLRERAYMAQQGCCFYCSISMWLHVPEEVAAPFDLTTSSVACLQCTAEHLVPKSEGGRDTEANVVAACLHCNRTRHRLKVPPSPIQYREHIQRRIVRGGWHPSMLRALLDSVLVTSPPGP